MYLEEERRVPEKTTNRCIHVVDFGSPQTQKKTLGSAPWFLLRKATLPPHQVGKLADAPVIHQRASQATHPADRSLVFRPVRPRVLEIFGAQQPHFARAFEGSSLRKRTVWPRSMCWNRKWFVASALLVGLQLLSRDMWSDLYGTLHQTKQLPRSALHDRARSLISHMYIDVHTSLVFHCCKSVCPTVASLLSQSSTIFLNTCIIGKRGSSSRDVPFGFCVSVSIKMDSVFTTFHASSVVWSHSFAETIPS